MKSSFFVVRVGADWFSLPEEVVIAPDVSCFKAHLDACWKNLPSIFKSFSLQMPSHACSIECYRTAIMSMTLCPWPPPSQKFKLCNPVLTMHLLDLGYASHLFLNRLMCLLQGSVLLSVKHCICFLCTAHNILNRRVSVGLGCFWKE